jgi:hypothetical protein
VEYCNAFLGKADRPSDDEVITALGPTAELWNEFIAWIAKEEGVSGQEWKGIYVSQRLTGSQPSSACTDSGQTHPRGKSPSIFCFWSGRERFADMKLAFPHSRFCLGQEGPFSPGFGLGLGCA